VRAGLAVADALHGALGPRPAKVALDALRAASGGRLPKWSPNLPRPARFEPPPHAPAWAGDGRIVYFPSCAARTMGPQRGDGEDALPVAAQRLFRKAGFDVAYPWELGGLCCGQPFESKGFPAAADRKAAELEAALAAASDHGRLPVVFDTSPCAWRMRRFAGARLPVLDIVEFLHDALLPRVEIERVDRAVAIHPVCSLRKMGSEAKLAAVAARCGARVVEVPEVLCCGFAGDKGFTRPELNEHALRHLAAALPADCREGYSTSRACEIGLSERSGIPYRSIVHLVDACARAPAVAGP
jgi:D-lactate dehydrogenase